MSLTARLLEDGFVPVDLATGNVKPGDEVVNRDGELASKYTAAEFERLFLVDKR